MDQTLSFTRRHVMVAGAMGLIATTAPAWAAKVGWAIGEILPDMAFKTPEGAMRKVSDYADRAVMLYFAGSWCPYCQQQMPQIIDIWKRTKDDPRLAWIVLAYKEKPEVTRDWINKRLGAPMPIMDPDNNAATSITLLNGNKMNFKTPTGYVLDPGGVIRYWREGIRKTENYETSIAEAVALVKPKPS